MNIVSMLERWEIPFFCSGIRYANMPTLLELAIASICLVIIRIEFHFRLLILLICIIQYPNEIWRSHFQYFQTLPFVRKFHVSCTLYISSFSIVQYVNLLIFFWGGGVIILLFFVLFYFLFCFFGGAASKSTNGQK